MVEISSRNIYLAMFKSISFSSLKHCIWEQEEGEDSLLVQISTPDVANNERYSLFDEILKNTFC